MTAHPDRPPDPRMSPEGAAEICAWLAGAGCARTGEIWVAGGGYIRAARAMEGTVRPFDPDALDSAASMRDARWFNGGEAAFADFYANAFGEVQ
jgi:hypothetical protein